jgi:hypothetical protein
LCRAKHKQCPHVKYPVKEALYGITYRYDYNQAIKRLHLAYSFLSTEGPRFIEKRENADIIAILALQFYLTSN